MEQKYKSLSIFEFQERFPDDDAYYAYLSALKWEDGYSCVKCGNLKYGHGAREVQT